MMGYSSGFCLKKVSKLLAFGLGGIFIVVQAMSYNGYINVNYGGIQKDIEVCDGLFFTETTYAYSHLVVCR